MFIKGLLLQNTLIGCRVYKDSDKQNLLVQSNPVTVNDFIRTGDWYGELRFDFDTKKAYTIGHTYYLEFFIDNATYPVDDNNFIGLVLDHDSPLATIDQTKRVIRHSMFFQKL